MNASTNTLRTSLSRRSGLLLVALIAALLAAFALVLTVSQGVDAQGKETKTVEVKAYQAGVVNKGQANWTHTGINLPEGASVGIAADGKVNLDANTAMFQGVEPDGIERAVYPPTSEFVAPELKVGSLVGRIGSSDPFKVGDGKWINPVTTAGELQLIVNDSYFDNNSGSFFADVSVYYPDTTGPRVISTVPVARAEGVAPSAYIKANFSENMKASTINDKTFMLFKNGSTTKVDASVVYKGSMDRAILNPTDSLRSGVTYKAVVSTYAKDQAGNPLDQRRGLSGLQPKVWHFKFSD
jgi:hypothetical protein